VYKQLLIENWTWECGDGCCSDSGCKCYIADSSYINKQWVGERNHTIDDDGACIPVGIILDAIGKVYDDQKFPKPFRPHFFAACGITDTIPDWHYTSSMPNMNIEQAKAVFKYFDIEIDIYIREA
jgi:hypothetical protein